MSSARRFVIAMPARSVCDDNARALLREDALRFLALGTRRGAAGIPADLTQLFPVMGLLSFMAAKSLSLYRAESFAFGLLPFFDRWVKQKLQPGDHVISSYGYTNECFKWARSHGGSTFVNGGNSHPENFWNILIEEHRRWKCDVPPISPSFYRRALAMMEHVDYVLCPSAFVRESFLARGFRPQQMLRNVYPVDLSCFSPASEVRPKNRPLTIISTGALSLRKGAPYMLEAFRLVHRRHPSARFLLTSLIQNSAAPIVKQYADLPIDWSPGLPHRQLAERLRSADIFVLPSLEEGLVRTALEAMACGLPVVLTPNTGANDFVIPGQSGEVVPIRDPVAIADAILKWAEIVMNRVTPPARLVDPALLSVETFERDFIHQLKLIGHLK